MLERKPLGSRLGSPNPRLTLDQVQTEEVEGEPFEAVNDTAAIEFAATQAG